MAKPQGTQDSTLTPGVFDTPMPPPVDPEVMQKEKAIDDAMRDLSNHPGWKRLRKMFEEQIEKYEKVQPLAAIEDDAERGRKVQVNLAVATELRGVLGEADQYAGRT